MPLRAWLKYKIDELLARSAWGKITLLVVFTGLVVLLGMSVGLVGLFDPANAEVEGIALTHGDWRDALWWAVRHILDPTFFYAQYGATPAVMVVSLVVSIGGLVVFGALLGLIIATLEERLDILRRGDSDVLERGHVLILGWNAKVPGLIGLFMLRRQRQTVVVLAPQEPDELREALRLAGVDGRRVRVVLRSGTADSLAELERVAWGAAQAVMVLPSETLEATAADAAVVRTMLLLRQQARPDGRPKIVAEIGHQAHAEAARRAGGGIPVVTSAEVVARMLCQCARQRHMSAVFDEMLSPLGANLLVRPAPACTGLRFDELVWAYPSAVPLGISRQTTGPDGRIAYQHTLLPPPSHRLAPDEWVLLLTRQDETASPSGPAPAASPFQSPAPMNKADTQLRSVLILGWSDALLRLLREFDSANGAAPDITVVSGHTPDEAQALLDDAGLALQRTQPVFLRRDVLLPGVMAGLAPAGFDAIVALADRSWHNADADARTLMNLVVLQPLLDGPGARPRLVVEALNPATREAARGLGVDDLVVGPLVISHLLMMVSEQMMVAGVLADLLGSTDCTLYWRPVSDLAPEGMPCEFATFLGQAQAQGELALGVCTESETTAAGWPAVHLVPGHGPGVSARRWGPCDRVLVMRRNSPLCEPHSNE
jgi:ion channel POLLUX/CASTOR